MTGFAIGMVVGVICFLIGLAIGEKRGKKSRKIKPMSEEEYTQSDRNVY